MTIYIKNIHNSILKQDQRGVQRTVIMEVCDSAGLVLNDGEIFYVANFSSISRQRALVRPYSEQANNTTD